MVSYCQVARPHSIMQNMPTGLPLFDEHVIAGSYRDALDVLVIKSQDMNYQ
jgi:hypothetical protein